MIDRWSRLFEETAEVLDSRAEQTRPERVDAGPFALAVQDIIEATVAQYVHLIMSLENSADKLRKVAKVYRKMEEQNNRFLSPIHDRMLTFDPELFSAWGLGSKNADR